MKHRMIQDCDKVAHHLGRMPGPRRSGLCCVSWHKIAIRYITQPIPITTASIRKPDWFPRHADEETKEASGLEAIKCVWLSRWPTGTGAPGRGEIELVTSFSTSPNRSGLLNTRSISIPRSSGLSQKPDGLWRMSARTHQYRSRGHRIGHTIINIQALSGRLDMDLKLTLSFLSNMISSWAVIFCSGLWL
jgi:hypothetical protein